MKLTKESASLNECRNNICDCLSAIVKLRKELASAEEEKTEFAKECVNLRKAIDYLEKKAQKTIKNYEKKLATRVNEIVSKSTIEVQTETERESLYIITKQEMKPQKI
jgi:phage shock protein A